MKLKKYFWQWLGLLLIVLAYIFGLGPHFIVSFVLLGIVGVIDAYVLIVDRYSISRKIRKQFKWQWDFVILTGLLIHATWHFWGKTVVWEQLVLFIWLFAIWGHFFWSKD